MSKPIESRRELFVAHLRHLYNIEAQVILMLPGLAEAADSPELKRFLGEQEERCLRQKADLERIFERYGEAPSGELCETMKRLVEAWPEHAAKTGDATLRDLILIGHCDRVSHNKIAAYGYGATLAACLGSVREAGGLAEALEAESSAARRLLRNASRILAPEERALEKR